MLKCICLPSLMSPLLFYAMLAELHAAFTVKHPHCCHKPLGICLLDYGNAISLGIRKQLNIPLPARYTYTAAQSASRHSLQSNWLINELLSHQRQQPVGSSIPYLET